MIKFIFLSLASFSFSTQAFANQVSLETMFTCQQDDGDQWVEVGIALNDGPGLQALVVAHNVDDDTAKLVAHRRVSSTTKSGKIVFEDRKQTVKLVLTKKHGHYVGFLSVLQDGPNSILQNNLVCYEKSTISFDRN